MFTNKAQSGQVTGPGAAQQAMNTEPYAAACSLAVYANYSEQPSFTHPIVHSPTRGGCLPREWVAGHSLPPLRG